MQIYYLSDNKITNIPNALVKCIIIYDSKTNKKACIINIITKVLYRVERDNDWFALTGHGGDDAGKQSKKNDDCQRHFQTKYLKLTWH